MLKREDLNRDLLRAEYAVRGAIPTRALQLEAQGRKVIYCNIGNPLAFAQRPLTYLRQILRSENWRLLRRNPPIFAASHDPMSTMRGLMLGYIKKVWTGR